MKVAIVVEGTRGDVYPMLALARSLTTAGHQVRMCAPPDFGPEVRAAGTDFIPLGVNIKQFITGAAELMHRGGRHFLREMTRFGKISVEHQFAVLPEATAGMDRIFAAGTILGAASAAELHGIPFRYVAYTPAIVPSPEHSPAVLPFQLASKRGNRALWWSFRKLMNAVAGRDVNRWRAKIGLPPVRDLAAHVLSERPIIAVDRPLAQMPAGGPFDFEQIRCLHPLSGEPLPAKLESFLVQGPAPVYLGFGSMPDPDPEQTTRGLLDAFAELGCRALISRGWAGLGTGPLPEGVVAIDPVCHASLFPRLTAVVHHGGAGTTHSAARAGVPQIIIPHVLDQFYFARRVVDLGVGPPPIPRRKLCLNRLVETLRATLGNEFLATRARELALRLAELGPAEPDVERLLAARGSADTAEAVRREPSPQCDWGHAPATTRR